MSPRSKLALSLPLAFSVAACSSGSGPTVTDDPIEPGPQPVSIALDPALNPGGIQSEPVGITVAPDTGKIYVLDAGTGLFEYEPNTHEFTQVTTAPELYWITPQSQFTDIAALPNEKFALTAMNDGFRYDLRTGAIEQYFCYVPGWILDLPEPMNQLTNSVVWDSANNILIAQPVTTNLNSGLNEFSQVGTFPESGGEGDDWHPIQNPDFLAGAATTDHGTVYLGNAESLYRYDLTTDTLELDQSLARFRIENIQGMAFTDDELLVVDGTSRKLVRIPRELL